MANVKKTDRVLSEIVADLKNRFNFARACERNGIVVKTLREWCLEDSKVMRRVYRARFDRIPHIIELLEVQAEDGNVRAIELLLKYTLDDDLMLEDEMSRESKIDLLREVLT